VLSRRAGQEIRPGGNRWGSVSLPTRSASVSEEEREMSQSLRFIAMGAAVATVLALGNLTLAGEAKPAAPTGTGGAGVSYQPGTMYYGLPGYYLLQTESVQKEIDLTPQQKEKLQEIAKKYYDQVSEQAKEYQKTDWAKVQQMKPDDQKKFYDELRGRQAKQSEVTKKWTEEAKKQVEQVLQPKQIEQLKDIAFRQRAASMLYMPQVLDQLGLSDEQKATIGKIREKLQARMAKAQQRMMQMQSDSNRKAIGVLTPQQLEKLKTLSEKGYSGWSPTPVVPAKPKEADKDR
jgi:Spy/CpxP family protein refolding chaperone